MRILLFLLTYLFPLLAKAADNPTAFDTNVYGLSLTPAATDVSLNYLGYIFGSVDGVLHGAGSQILGTMFGVYNTAVLSLGGIILLYTLIVSTLNTAHEGEVMGKKWSSIWIPMRSALGVGLLVPKASGYSVIQIFMMWVIVQGIGAANSVWNAATTYLEMGGVMVVRPTVGNTGTTTYFKNMDLSKDLLKSLVCVYMLQDKGNQLREAEIKELQKQNKPVPTYMYEPINLIGQLTSSIQDIYGKAQALNKNTSLANVVKLSIPNSDPNNANNACGVLKIPENDLASFNKIGMSFSDYSDAQKNLILNARLIAVAQMIAELSPTAKQIVDIVNNKRLTKEQGLETIIGTEVLRTSATTYGRLIAPAINMNSTNVLLRNELSRIKADGWLMAGSYFSVVTRTNISAIPNDSIMSPSFMPGSAPQTDDIQAKLPKNYISADEMNALLGDNSKLANYLKQYGKLEDYSNEARAVNTIPIASLIAGLLPVGLGPAADKVIKKIDGVLRFITDPINQLFSSMDNVAPMSKLAIIGTTIITGSEKIIAAIIAIIVAVTVALSAVPFMSLGTIMEVINGWLVPIFLPIVFALWGFSAILAFYIPIVPYLLFTFVSLGWFFAVIEAMVAAPLVALGIVHPEGHEAFGRAEPAVMLIINVFLKPTLIIFGFVSGIILSYIALWLLNKGFGYVYITSLFSPGMMLLGAMVWILALIVFVGTYAISALLIVQKCFELIHVIPAQVMTWIGGHTRDYGLQNAVGEIKQQGAQGALQQSGEFAKGAYKTISEKMGGEKKQSADGGGAEIEPEDPKRGVSGGENGTPPPPPP